MIVNAEFLNVTGGSQVSASTFGQGNAGNVIINARNRASFNDGLVFSSVEANAVGRGGNVEITTGSLDISNGGQMIASTFGTGDAGNVMINARDYISFIGTSADGQLPSGVFTSVGTDAIGKGGNIQISTNTLSVLQGARLISSTFGTGDAGNIVIDARDRAVFSGASADGQFRSSAFSTTETNEKGNAGNISITTASLDIMNGGQLVASTFGNGNAGNVSINADSINIKGKDASGIRSGVFATVETRGQGQGGNIQIRARSLAGSNDGVIATSTLGFGNAGNIEIDSESIVFDGSKGGIFADIEAGARGNGGNILINTQNITLTNSAKIGCDICSTGIGNAGNLTINADSIVFDGKDSGVYSGAESQTQGNGGNITITGRFLSLTNGAIITAFNLGSGNPGNIDLKILESIQVSGGSITTRADQSGGNINITARTIRLQNNGDITTNSRTGDGGNITLTADSIIALDDSDILAFAQGKGGNITLNTRAFFGQNYRPAPRGTDPFTLIGNGRVDVNASGAVSGIISLPDVSFLQNGLTEFPQTLTDTTQLLANSCIVRSSKQNGKFFITGSGGLPLRPGDAPLSPFPTGEVRNVAVDAGTDETAKPSPSSASSAANPLPRPWKIGDPIVEPDGVYQLANGDLVMSRECK